MKGDIMTAAAEKDAGVYMRGRDRNFTEEEYHRISDEYFAAEARGDEVERLRLLRLIPMNPMVIKAFAEVYGRDFVIESGYDLTEANIAYGKGWLDEIE
jgi:hypothetical protein